VQARRRAGARLFRVLFQRIAGPIATAKTKGAFLGGLRLMAVDGTTLDLADTPANEQAFGRPTTHRGQATAAPVLGLACSIPTLCCAPISIRPPLRGAAAAAGEALMFRHAGVSVTPVLVNGAAGILSRTLDGRLFSVMSFTVARGRVVESTSWPILRTSVALAWRSRDSA
jgi:hypothetical protein